MSLPNRIMPIQEQIARAMLVDDTINLEEHARNNPAVKNLYAAVKVIAHYANGKNAEKFQQLGVEQVNNKDDYIRRLGNIKYFQDSVKTLATDAQEYMQNVIRIQKLQGLLKINKNKDELKAIKSQIKTLEKDNKKLDKKMDAQIKKIIVQKHDFIKLMAKDVNISPQGRVKILDANIKSVALDLKSIGITGLPIMSFEITEDKGARESGQMLKKWLSDNKKAWPKSAMNSFNRFNELAKSFDNALAKEQKENLKELQQARKQLAQKIESPNWEGAIKELEGRLNDMIRILDQRSHLVHGNDYVKNQRSLGFYVEAMKQVRQVADSFDNSTGVIRDPNAYFQAQFIQVMQGLKKPVHIKADEKTQTLQGRLNRDSDNDIMVKMGKPDVRKQAKPVPRFDKSDFSALNSLFKVFKAVKKSERKEGKERVKRLEKDQANLRTPAEEYLASDRNNERVIEVSRTKQMENAFANFERRFPEPQAAFDLNELKKFCLSRAKLLTTYENANMFNELKKVEHYDGMLKAVRSALENANSPQDLVKSVNAYLNKFKPNDTGLDSTTGISLAKQERELDIDLLRKIIPPIATIREAATRAPVESVPPAPPSTPSPDSAMTLPRGSAPPPPRPSEPPPVTLASVVPPPIHNAATAKRSVKPSPPPVENVAPTVTAAPPPPPPPPPKAAAPKAAAPKAAATTAQPAKPGGLVKPNADMLAAKAKQLKKVEQDAPKADAAKQKPVGTSVGGMFAGSAAFAKAQQRAKEAEANKKSEVKQEEGSKYKPE